MIKKDRRSCLFIKKEQQQREKRVKDFYIYNNKVYIKMEKPNIITRRKIYRIYIYDNIKNESFTICMYFT